MPPDGGIPAVRLPADEGIPAARLPADGGYPAARMLADRGSSTSRLPAETPGAMLKGVFRRHACQPMEVSSGTPAAALAPASGYS